MLTIINLIKGLNNKMHKKTHRGKGVFSYFVQKFLTLSAILRQTLHPSAYSSPFGG
jgi:hypothetical protein